MKKPSQTARNLFFLAALFLTFTGFSQERYLEVTAYDTISLKSTKILCEISLGSVDDYMEDYMEDEGNKKPKSDETSMADVTKILDQNKFKYTAINQKLNSEPSLYTKGNPIFIVEVKNESELTKLTTSLEKFEDVNIKINDIFYESANAYLEKSYTNLYMRAMTQASLLAKISSNTVGKLISASDVKNQLFDYDDIYKEMYKNMPKGLFGSSYLVQEKQQIIKMVFKFELK